MVWKPLVSRFKEIQDRMSQHEILLLREFDVLGQEGVNKHFEEVETFLRVLKDGEAADPEQLAKAQGLERQRISKY